MSTMIDAARVLLAAPILDPRCKVDGRGAVVYRELRADDSLLLIDLSLPSRESSVNRSDPKAPHSLAFPSMPSSSSSCTVEGSVESMDSTVRALQLTVRSSPPLPSIKPSGGFDVVDMSLPDTSDSKVDAVIPPSELGVEAALLPR